jgi:hypothetical protein
MAILASTRIRQTGEFSASTRIRQIRRRVAIAYYKLDLTDHFQNAHAKTRTYIC